MDPKYDEDSLNLDDTVRVMRRHVDNAGELQFRQTVASGFEKVENRLGKIDVRLARIEERQISRTTVAEIVRVEMASTLKDVARLEKILWGTIGTFIGTIIVTAVTILVTKALR